MLLGTVFRSHLAGLGHALAAALIGLVGLPLLRATDTGPAWVWLALATLASVWLLAPALTLTRGLERLLARTPVHSGHAAHASAARVEIARLLIAATYLVLLQAIMRRPLVLTFGAAAEPFVIEATFGVAALIALVILLGWIHRAARPLVEGLARLTLDSLLATSVSEVAAARAERTSPGRSAAQPTVQRTQAHTPQPTLGSQHVASHTSVADQTLPGSAPVAGPATPPRLAVADQTLPGRAAVANQTTPSRPAVAGESTPPRTAATGETLTAAPPRPNVPRTHAPAPQPTSTGHTPAAVAGDTLPAASPAAFTEHDRD